MNGRAADAHDVLGPAVSKTIAVFCNRSPLRADIAGRLIDAFGGAIISLFVEKSSLQYV